MTADETRAGHLATGSGGPTDETERLDLIRGLLSAEATWAEPPPQVLDGVLATLDQGEGRQIEAPRPPERRWPVTVAIIGSAAAVVALVLSTVAVLGREPADDIVFALSGTDLEEDATGTAAVHPTDSGWWIRLDLTGLPPAPAGTYYEGWVWSETGEGVSIGTFHQRGGEGPIILWSGVELDAYPSIWVTLEDEDGIAAASDRVVMRGRMPDAA